MLFAQWKFDDATDAPVTENTGTLSSLAVTNSPASVDGVFNKALSFNEDLQSPNAQFAVGTAGTEALKAILNWDHNFTISGWVKCTYGSGNQCFMWIGMADATSFLRLAWEHGVTGSLLVAQGYGTGNGVFGNNGGEAAGLILNEWNHFAVRKTGAVLDIFVNGSLVQTVTFPWVPQLTAYDGTNSYIVFGMDEAAIDNDGSSFGTSSFSGQLDEFRIYDGALTTDNITLLYEGQEPLEAELALSNDTKKRLITALAKKSAGEEVADMLASLEARVTALENQ